ncbi:MAG: methyltransferase [Pseudomonadota bacterium]
MATGFSHTQVLTACVQLDLFEFLAQGPKTTEEVSTFATMSDEAAQCLLKAASELGLVSETRSGLWRLGELGAATRGNPGITAMIRHNQLLYRDFANPTEVLRARGATELSRYWTYARSANESASASAQRYSDLMAQSQSFVADDVLAHAPIAGRRHLLDIGGGSGVFASEALRRYPKLEATVFDLPTVAPLAEDRFRELELADRGCAAAGSMFDDPLPRDADVVSLVRILHDHDDQPARSLLNAVRNAISDDGILLIAEPMAGTKTSPSVGVYFQLYLWAMRSGRPRTREELTAMLHEAGFASVREIKTYQPLLVRLLVARPT